MLTQNLARLYREPHRYMVKVLEIHPHGPTPDTGTTTLCRNPAQLRPAAPPQTIPLRSPPLPYVQPSLPATPPPSSSFAPHELNQPPTAASPQPEDHTARPFIDSSPQQSEQQTSRNLRNTDRTWQTTRSGRLICKPTNLRILALARSRNY